MFQHSRGMLHSIRPQACDSTVERWSGTVEAWLKCFNSNKAQLKQSLSYIVACRKSRTGRCLKCFSSIVAKASMALSCALTQVGLGVITEATGVRFGSSDSPTTFLGGGQGHKSEGGVGVRKRWACERGRLGWAWAGGVGLRTGTGVRVRWGGVGSARGGDA